MLYRVLIGVGLLALGYYLGRQVGRVEGQMGQFVEPLQENPAGEPRRPEADES